MKKLLGTLAAFVLAVTTFAQVNISGTVKNKENKPLEGATVTLRINDKKERTALTNNAGSFEFTNVTANAVCKLVVEYVGMQKEEESFTTTDNKTFDIVLNDLAFLLEPLEVKAIRASDRAPFTKTDISKKDLAKLNQGQDIPFLLNQTPSVVVNSDAGTGIGYTGIRIRGSDATRINVTLNGIPYNDAESQGTYFVDLPDFASSINSIQVQRGVGTSTNGAGAFGATINMSTNEFNETAYGESNNSFGSFNTWKNTIKVGSGLISDHFTIDARLSRISSDGYVDRASSNLQSFYFSPAYTSKNTSIRLNVFSGKEKTYQSWYGLPEALLQTDRTYNAAGTEKPGEPYDNQTDNYQQDHYQLFVNQVLNSSWSLNVASFLTRGKGYYEEYKAEQSFEDYGLENVVIGSETITATDLVRDRWLDNYFYGQIFSLQYKKAKDELTVGGSWTKYDGKHHGDIIWANVGIPKDYRYYFLTANKNDANVYAKWLHQVSSSWNVFADLQYRRVVHDMNGFEDNPELMIKRNFNFVNPKAGISYFNNGYHAYLSYALAHHEPNRDDFEANPSQQPEYETLHDVELSIDKKTSQFNWGATFYYMYYNNQLVLTGKINDVGSYTRTNVPGSYRMGVELQGGVVIDKWVNAAANLSLSRNKIKSFTEYIDDWDENKQQSVEHSNTNISFSPSVIAGGSINILPFKNTELSLLGKYVGRQYMDNTQNKNRSLNDYYVQDIRAIYNAKNVLFKEWNFILQVNNVFNKKYEPNGYTYPYFYEGSLVNDNYYYPMAGTNFMLSVNVKL
ncbi:TonB-dependent receptor [Panacibacter ginsenosidivorans]|uniref:TonB-dependent receptor n=1 Tax=Panacibacter ginsenosidivorans TaxID=1813871 RepID=A0A5B8V6B6_9BACT|nr:TonB-dependent receptor [Panacibacter ginsenosidivorans]QEC66403.1 TonB-dependent receptor [Panacibacter ginsenosidivorans]